MVNGRVNRAATFVLAASLVSLLGGCGGGSLFGASGGSSESSGSSLTSRFSQLFGSNSQAASTSSGPSTQAIEDSELTCPSVNIRFGASTLAVGLPGKPASGTDLRYQGVINRTARDCNLSGGQITARVGVQGRVIVGPAGAPPTVEIPIRVAVVQDGAPEKVIVTKVYKTSVAVGPNDSSVEFSLVAEDLVYPAPKPKDNDSYIFYVGFDPAALKPEAPARGRKHR